MKNSDLDDVFAEHIYPGFPFKDKSWLALALERDSYDGTRMSQDLFSNLRSVFDPDSEEVLWIFGDLIESTRVEGIKIPFQWDAYRNFVLSDSGFSLEYKIVAGSGLLAVWADADLTLIGGEASAMEKVLSVYGGRDAFLKIIETQFFGDYKSGNEDMRCYFRSLLKIGRETKSS